MNSNNSHQTNCAAIGTTTSHIPFTNMADYIYSSGREENFMATAAKINKQTIFFIFIFYRNYKSNAPNVEMSSSGACSFPPTH